MFLSIGSPGSILLSTPSSPASNNAVKHKYGLADGSGGRYSIRLAFGLSLKVGIRIAALRLRALYARFTGASNPATSRLSLLVVRLHSPHNSLACCKIPPTY